MSSHRFSRVLLVSTALGAGIAAPAFAQSLVPPAPVRQSVDANGVDLFLGTLNAIGPTLSMGQGGQALSYHKLNTGSGWTSNFDVSLVLQGSLTTVRLGGASDSFTASGGVYTSTEGNGATLTYNSSQLSYTYTGSDGTIVLFSKNNSGSSDMARGVMITKPTGEHIGISYDTALYCGLGNDPPPGCAAQYLTYRVNSVYNYTGYQLNYTYASNTIDSSDPDADTSSWHSLRSVSIKNSAVPSSAEVTQTFTGAAVSGDPTMSYFEVVDALSRTTKYKMSWTDGVVGITRPGDTSESETIGYTSGRVSTITTVAGTTHYSAPVDSAGVRTVTVTDPSSHVTTYTFDIASQRMTSMTDALSHTTRWTYDGSGRLTKVTAPEGNYVQYTLDGRGNASQATSVAKSGSGLTNITTFAAYPSTCSNPVTCNEPTSTTDANGNVTDYTYDPTTGEVLTVTAPAPSTGAVRPKTTYTYTNLHAYYDTGSGSSTASPFPVTLLTGVSQCQTTAACTGTSDEVVKSIGYGPQTVGVGNNLLPVSITTRSGDSTLSATTTLTYDAAGDLLTVDGPLSGTADTTTYRYDLDRERVGAISADPDGSGSLKQRAERLSYNGNGQVTRAELGTVAGTTDADWSAFVTKQQVDTIYDGYGVSVFCRPPCR